MHGVRCVFKRGRILGTGAVAAVRAHSAWSGHSFIGLSTVSRSLFLCEVERGHHLQRTEGQLGCIAPSMGGLKGEELSELQGVPSIGTVFAPWWQR